MFCKNLIIYDFKDTSSIASINNELLSKIAYTPCCSTDSAKSGFISPVDDPDILMMEIDNQVLLKYQFEQKILPLSVIKDKLTEKVTKHEQLIGCKLTKSEKISLKDELMIDLLPIAFSKFEQIYVWIDKTNNTIAITTSSFKKAESVLAHLRKELGVLSLTPIYSEQPAETILTNWLQGDKPNCFKICDSAVLCDCVEPKSKIKLVNEQITDSREVQSYIDSGRVVESISLHFNADVKFTIKRDLTLSKITFDSSILDKNEDIAGSGKNVLIEANFLLATNVLSKLIVEIKSAFNQI